MVKGVSRDKWGMGTFDAIGDQLARFGITAYVEMDSEGEGRILLSGAEEGTGILDASMEVVASDGNLYTVWLNWNPDKTAPDGTKGYYELDSPHFANEATGKGNVELILWVEGQPIPIQDQGKGDNFSSKPWYIQSRKLLGLPVSEKQEEILRDFLLAHPGGVDDYQGRRIRGLEKTVTVLNQPPAKSDGN